MSHKHKWVLPSAAYLLLQLCLQSSLYSLSQGETTVTQSTEKSLNSIQDGWPLLKTSPILYPTTTTTDDQIGGNTDTPPNLDTTSVGLLFNSKHAEIVPTPHMPENVSHIHDNASDIISDAVDLDNFTSVLTLFPFESLAFYSSSLGIGFTGDDEPVKLSTPVWNDSVDDWLSGHNLLSSLSDISSTFYAETNFLSSTINPTSSSVSIPSTSSSLLVSTSDPVPSHSSISTDPVTHSSITTTTQTTPQASVTMTSVHNSTISPSTNVTHPLGEETRDPDQPLSTPAIIGIAFGVAAAVLLVAGVILVILKRRVFGQVKHDSSNYWDDNVTLSYINSHAEFPKDLDAEMMSLDDDSFLNSLDSMTFANLWATDTAKHTNF